VTATNQTSNINLVELYYILNSEAVPHYRMIDMFWGMFISFDNGELEEMGINTVGIDKYAIRESIFEEFSKKIINKILSQHALSQNDPFILKLKNAEGPQQIS
jgi:hypothetical protein